METLDAELSKSKLIEEQDQGDEASQEIKQEEKTLPPQVEETEVKGTQKQHSLEESMDSQIRGGMDFVTTSGLKVSVYETDITKLPVDVVVNAANRKLRHGRGVAFAIARAAGQNLTDECEAYIEDQGNLIVTQVVATTGGAMPCKKVLHAVGPHWDEYEDKGQCQDKLIETVYNCLRSVSEMGLVSVAIPSISSMLFRVPAQVCSQSYLMAVQRYEREHGGSGSLSFVSFVDIDRDMVAQIQRTFSEGWTTPLEPIQPHKALQIVYNEEDNQEDTTKSQEKIRAPPGIQDSARVFHATGDVGQEDPSDFPNEENLGRTRRPERTRIRTERGHEFVLKTRINNFYKEHRSLERLVQTTTSILKNNLYDREGLHKVQHLLSTKMAELLKCQQAIEEVQEDSISLEDLQCLGSQVQILSDQLINEIRKSTPPGYGGEREQSTTRKGTSNVSQSTQYRIQRVKNRAIEEELASKLRQLDREAKLQQAEADAKDLETREQEENRRKVQEFERKRQLDMRETKEREERIRQNLISARNRAEREAVIEEKRLQLIREVKYRQIKDLIAQSRGSASICSELTEMADELPQERRVDEDSAVHQWVRKNIAKGDNQQVKTLSYTFPKSLEQPQGRKQHCFQGAEPRRGDVPGVNSCLATRTTTTRTLPGASTSLTSTTPTTTAAIYSTAAGGPSGQTAVYTTSAGQRRVDFNREPPSAASFTPQCGPSDPRPRHDSGQSTIPVRALPGWSGVSTPSRSALWGQRQSMTTRDSAPRHLHQEADNIQDQAYERAANADYAGGDADSVPRYAAPVFMDYGRFRSHQGQAGQDQAYEESPRRSRLRHPGPTYVYEEEQTPATEYRHEHVGDSGMHRTTLETRVAELEASLSERGRVAYPSQNTNEPSFEERGGLEALTQTLANAITLNRLPTQQPSVFSGDSLEYPTWHASFSFLISNKNILDTEKLLYLRRFLGGSALEAVSGFFYMRRPEAFDEAMKILEARYGNSFTVGQAFRTKLEAWERIKTDDAVALRLFSDFLCQCQTAKNEIGGLDILDDPQYLRRLIDKLPIYLFQTWSRKVIRDRPQHPNRYPTFHEFAKFVHEEAEVANEPVFGAITRTFTAKPLLRETTGQTFRQRDRERETYQKNAKATETQPVHQPSQPSGKLQCKFCKLNNHDTTKCYQLEKLTKEKKVEFVRDNDLCFACLKKANHYSKHCKEKETCERCKGSHPTSMHFEKKGYHDRYKDSYHDRYNDTYQRSGNPAQNFGAAQHNADVPVKNTMIKQLHTNPEREGVAVNTRIAYKTNTNNETHLTSMILPVYLSVASQPETELLVYAMLDTMSNATFVLDSCARELNAPSKGATLELTTLSERNALVPCRRYEELCVRAYHSDEHMKLPVAFSRESLKADVSDIPTRETADRHPHLQRLVTDIPPLLDCPVGLLIGYDFAEALMPTDTIEGTPYAVQTKLGWSIVGATREGSSNEEGKLCHDEIIQGHQKQATSVFKARVREVSATELVQVLERDFTSLESGTASQDDRRFMEIVEENITKNDKGHYEMPLPFRNERPTMADNRSATMKRVQGLKRRFERDTTYKRDYVAFMDEIVSRGDAERVPADELNNVPRWYIPHHGVYHPKKPEKIRVVFDCSATYQGSCLNEELLQGPDLINSLTGVLHRFRKGAIAFSCDIEKMYHQFHVVPNDRDYLRFLWWENGDETGPLVDYRMTVHIFGATSSPGCANFGLKQVAKDYEEISQDASTFLQRDFYVDDGLQANDTVETATRTLTKAREIWSHANLRLHKITSNSTELLSQFPESEVSRVNITDLSATAPTPTVGRTLGLQWDTEKDTFSFSSVPKEGADTRRGVLSTIASLYDPLGFLAPFVLQGRLILQEMSSDGINWDDSLPERLVTRWRAWLDDFINLLDFQIPRSFLPRGFGHVTKVELHHFSDASDKGYGQCSYLRFVDSNDQYHSVLVTAKGRVTPLRPVTIPRKELQAAVLSAKVSVFLQEELHYDNMQHFFWTDSQIVLAYIRNRSKRFHVYVANRIQQILDVSEASQWRYIPTKDNPADHASRGCSVGELKSTNWLVGPAFLREELTEPTQQEFDILDGDVEVKRVMLTEVVDLEAKTWEDRFKRFSSRRSLIRAIAVLMRRCDEQGRRKQALHTDSGLTRLESYSLAEEKIIKLVQREFFDQQSQDKRDMKDLDSYLDDEGVLRVGGRSDRADVANELNHPVILPRQSHFSTLVVRSCHEKIAHQGRPLTINEVRRQGFWIIGIRRVVLSVLKDCTPCTRLRGKPEFQMMAELPEDRVNESPPFTHCGLDCFGPFYVKDGRREVKRYGLIITCLASRAVHIEVLDDMSTDAFISGLRVLISIRGSVRSIRCDRGTNFVGASNELKAAWREMDKEEIVTNVMKENCEFVFNPPTASHMGGLWERQIRTIRNIFAGLMLRCGKRLTSSSLRTLMYETMSIINSRPLSVESLESPDGPLPLTPNHLLTMKRGGIPPPPGEFSEADVYVRKRWRCVQRLADEFWERWRPEYLASLQPRRKWKSPVRNVMVGDIVMLNEDNAPRGHWNLARVVEAFPSKDGLVRSVRILLAAPLDAMGIPVSSSVVLTRPVHKMTVWMKHENNP